MSAPPAFGIVQLEFGHLLGPPDGRYLMRGAGDETDTVLVLGTLGAPQRRLLRRRRATAGTHVEPEPVPTARATVVFAEGFPDQAAAAAWLERLRSDEQALDEVIERGVGRLNVLLRAHRAAAADPYARDVARHGALVARVGYGDGDAAAAGRFSEVHTPSRPPPRPRRSEALAPQERLAAVLGGREEVMVAEELVLRARADLDAGRGREAALQARVALEALLADLERRDAAAPAVGAELRADRDEVARAANIALEADPPEELQEAVAAAVARMERALRRLRLSGI